MADSKKGHFPSLPILNIFFQKFHGLVGLIDAKGIDVAQSIWPEGLYKVTFPTLMTLFTLCPNRI